MTNEATVEASVTENLLPEAAPTEEVEAQVSDLPKDDKQTDEVEAEKVDDKKEDKPEPTEAEKIKYAMQKRIDKQTAKLAEFERLLAEKEQALLKTQPVQNDAPQESDFESYEDYLKAQGRWEALQEQKQENEKRAQADRDQAYQRMMSERKALFEQKEAEFKKVTPDYDEKTSEVETAISLLTDKQKSSVEFQVFRDMLFSSDEMPALTYELGKNPDLLDELLTMNPLQIARKIARLELQVENAPKPQLKPTVKPPTPITGSSKNSVNPQEMSPEEYMAWRNKQLKRK